MSHPSSPIETIHSPHQEKDHAPTTEEEALACVERYVHQQAHRYATPLCPYEDLLQEGRLSVLHAYTKFNRARGIKFMTYACFWIQRHMRRYRSQHDRLIHLPEYLITLQRTLRKIQAEAEQDERTPFTPSELAALLGVSVKQVEFALNTPDQPLSLDAPCYEDNQESWVERLSDSGKGMHAALEQRELWRVLDKLDPRQRLVILMRYQEAMNLEEIARYLGISRCRVQQLETQALRTLRTLASEWQPAERKKAA